MTAVAPPLHPQLAAINPALVVFDKDGTLIDFHAMWAAWVTELARQLETAAGIPVAAPLFNAVGFNAATGQIDPNGNLALIPMADFRALTAKVLQTAGVPAQRVSAVLATAWHLPDPVALARPVTDLAALFGALRRHGIKVAVATSDNRAATIALLDALGVAPLVDAFVCADDGIPIKPAPDMIFAICRALDVPPAQSVMVGDNLPDLQMGRAAGVGATVGVLTGVGAATALVNYADILLSSVEDLLAKAGA